MKSIYKISIVLFLCLFTVLLAGCFGDGEVYSAAGKTYVYSSCTVDIPEGADSTIVSEANKMLNDRKRTDEGMKVSFNEDMTAVYTYADGSSKTFTKYVQVGKQVLILNGPNAATTYEGETYTGWNVEGDNLVLVSKFTYDGTMITITETVTLEK